MAGPNDRFGHSEQQWFDAGNPGPLHEALRADYSRTRARALQRPSLRRHLESCATCAQIGQATATAPPPSATRRRLKLAIDAERMHALLRLPANVEIVHMFADHDPNWVFVLVSGEGLPETPADAETPLGRPDDVRGPTTDSPS